MKRFRVEFEVSDDAEPPPIFLECCSAAWKTGDERKVGGASVVSVTAPFPAPTEE